MLTVSTPAPCTLSPVLPGGYTPRERFIRLPEVLYTTGLSRSTVYEMMSRRQFPAQVSLGGKNVAWLASEVELWMDERIANRHQGGRMMRLTFGRQNFTLSDNDALFIAEAILLQRKEPGVVLPEHHSEKHGAIRLASRQAEPRLFRAGPVPLTRAAADTRNDQLTDC